MTDFSQYTKALLSALKTHAKAAEAVAKKQEILNGVYRFYNTVPDSILFVGFNPCIALATGEVSVTAIDAETQEYLKANNVKFKYVPFELLNTKYDCVVAMDEFFTFAPTDEDQKTIVQKLANVTGKFLITTLKDYKNQDFKDREFSAPAIVRNTDDNKIFLESHNWDLRDRANWDTTVYEITNPDHQLTTYGSFARRTMYFKQLAKFTADTGATNFLVHKNLMYKSLIKKNYEHVISVSFE